MATAKSISNSEEGVAAEEVRRVRKYFLAALIEHSFNFLFVATLVSYICLMFGALKYYDLMFAVAVIALMSPYFISMLYMLPILKVFYIGKYAMESIDTDAASNAPGRI